MIDETPLSFLITCLAVVFFAGFAAWYGAGSLGVTLFVSALACAALLLLVGEE